MKKLPPLQIVDIEEQTLTQWREQNTFAKSLAQTEGRPRFSFYDGPPFANGLPHFGHSLMTAIKDAMGRYKTMRGFYVERRNGWDCHGLPVEYEIEKKFHVSGKKQILELGLDKFNQACRESVFTYKHEWEAFFDRIGRWTDKEHAYATIDNSYIESVWWALNQVHKKGLLYRGFKSMPYCPRCETPLSNFELNEGYREGVEDPSLYVKFKLTDEDAFLLAWTTTPWSLPGNVALAVKPEAEYVRVRVTDDDRREERLILAKARLEVLDAEYEIEATLPGSELVGKRYEPLFEIQDFPVDFWRIENRKIYEVIVGDNVSIDEGTGVLHVAPQFGEEDLALAETYNMPTLNTVTQSGRIQRDVVVPEKYKSKITGELFKAADPAIIEHLTELDRVYNAETISHIYPFCYRCESPLLYYAITTWFIKVSEIRDQLLKNAESIQWVPEHVKAGRFGQWLEGARDWAISRNRYWGSPLPIWVNENDSDDYIVIESVAELRQLAKGDPSMEDLHRPSIDAVVIERDGKTYRRVEEVLDCWFESGSMPYAQVHYPFENEEQFNESFPADYVGEGMDQTRLWFYVLHVLATILKQQPAYKNVIVNGMIMAADGQKLSKRLRNYPPLDEVFSKEGADSLRYYLLSSPASVGDYMRFSRDGVRDVSRNLFATFYNSAAFLSLYAEIEGWQPERLSPPTADELDNPLDRWLVARVQQTAAAVTEGADSYDLARATRPLAELVDDLSNWYVRRSRRRFSKNDDKKDQASAFRTLHWALLTTTQLLAPWAPFMSDYLWRHLTAGLADVAESVHLTTWPDLGKPNESILVDMAFVRGTVNLGLAKRAEAGIRVRQPLASVMVVDALLDNTDCDYYEAIIREELNVKRVITKRSGDMSLSQRQQLVANDGYRDQARGQVEIDLDTTITPELEAEGWARDAVRHIQAARKQVGLNVADHIDLTLTVSSDQLAQALRSQDQLLRQEVQADQLTIETNNKIAAPVRLGEAGNLGITLTKVA